MAYENNQQHDRNNDSVFSKRLKAGRRRTYFFDVKTTRANDYFLAITESKKRFNDNGYDRHKIFLYKEDFNKFLSALTETIDYVKTDLMPDFDFDAFNHDNHFENHENHFEKEEQPAAQHDAEEIVIEQNVTENVEETPSASQTDEIEVDKW